MGTKADRKVAIALVRAHHERQLAGLIEHVSEAIERYRHDELWWEEAAPRSGR